MQASYDAASWPGTDRGTRLPYHGHGSRWRYHRQSTRAQEGAQKIADAENIISARLDKDSPTDSILQFLHHVMRGFSVTERLRASVVSIGEIRLIPAKDADAREEM